MKETKKRIANSIQVPKLPIGGDRMRKEIGIPKNAPKSAKKADEKADKKAGIKEGSKADLKKDKQIMKSYKKGKK